MSASRWSATRSDPVAVAGVSGSVRRGQRTRKARSLPVASVLRRSSATVGSPAFFRNSPPCAPPDLELTADIAARCLYPDLAAPPDVRPQDVSLTGACDAWGVHEVS